MTSSLTRSSARAESGRSESRPGVSPRESISEKKVTALNAVAFFVDLPPLLQRRIESATERCCGRDRCHSGGFLLRIMPPSWHLPLPAPHDCAAGGLILAVATTTPAVIPKSGSEIKNRCSYKNRRRNYSSLQLRKLESDAEDRCRYESSRRNHSSLQRRNLNRTRRIVAATATAGETILLSGRED